MDWHDVRYWHRANAPKAQTVRENFPLPSSSDVFVSFLLNKDHETRTASLSPVEYERLVELSEPEWIPDWEFGTLFWRPIRSADRDVSDNEEA